MAEKKIELRERNETNNGWHIIHPVTKSDLVEIRDTAKPDVWVLKVTNGAVYFEQIR